jgi:Tfp pilus assembly protein PilV
MLKNNRGDTIVEVLIALCVLGVAIIGASTSVNNSYARTINANYRQQALQLLNNQIELIKGGNNETNNGGITLSTL